MFNASLFLGSAYWPASLVILITMALGLAALQRSEPMLASTVFALPFLLAVILPAPTARLLRGWNGLNLSVLRFVIRTALCVIVMATLIAVATQSPWTLPVYVLLLLVGTIDQVI